MEYPATSMEITEYIGTSVLNWKRKREKRDVLLLWDENRIGKIELALYVNDYGNR